MDEVSDFWRMPVIISTLLFLLLGYVMISLYNWLIIRPKRIREFFRKQGINGPKPRILIGNIIEIKKSRQDAQNPTTIERPPISHNTASVFPFIEKWRNQYGPIFTFSLGKMEILCANSPDLVKEISTVTSMELGRPSYQQRELGPLLGQGILTSNGSVWAMQRKIMAPELYMDKVKGMMSIITESADALINSWKHQIETCGDGIVDIRVDKYMKRFSGEIISRACFGSSYSKGEEIFLKLGDLQTLISKRPLSAGIPGLRYLPTKTNMKIRSLEKEISALILKIVKERQKAGNDKDLLQILLEGAKNNGLSSDALDRFVVDNCRNIYLAGFETSAVSASWCLMLLASNPECQSRIRDEVKEVSQGQIPDINMLRQMKQLHMVIQETMRLYPPAPTLAREVFEDMKIGNIQVPKGVNLWTMVATLHTDTTIWGPDALEFNPQRFENGIAGACKSPSCYIPFGFGQRVCVGQHLAVVELKLLVALIVSNFSFTLSPNYVHAPSITMIIEPKHGVNILIKKL